MDFKAGTTEIDVSMTPRRDERKRHLMQNFIKLTLNLFDEGGAGTSSAGVAGTGEGSASTSTANTVRKEVAQKGRSMGLSEDLLADYQKAYDSKNTTSKPTAAETQTETNTENQSEDLESEFDSLVKGRFKDVYDKRTSGFVKDRLSKRDAEIAQLKTQNDGANKIINLLAQKYPNVDRNNLEALFEAVKNDNDTWSQKSLDTGLTADEARKQYDEDQKRLSMENELNELKREKATRELDAHFQNLALETKQMYPDFDLQTEFSNPDFCAALDFIAQKNEARNKASGKNDEIFNLTYAYELAHADEIRNKTVKKVAKATMSAVTQDIIANGRRPRENANSNSVSTKPKSTSEMSEAEFDNLLKGIKAGTAHIPRG